MLSPDVIEALNRAIDERIVRLERRVEKTQAEIANLEASKDLFLSPPPPTIDKVLKEI